MNSNERNLLNEQKKENTFQQMIIYRSLFILKKKFELHKGEINSIYQKYYIDIKGDDPSPSSLINVDSLLSVITEIEEQVSVSVFPISRPNELFVSDLIMNVDKKYEKELVLHQLCQYVKSNMKKYNQLYIEKRDKALNKGDSSSHEDIQPTKKPITEYDKEGGVTKTNEEMIKENETSPLKPFQEQESLRQEEAKIEEEDDKNKNNSKDKDIKNNNSCIYIQTLPVIIADYIQMHSDIALIDTNEELSQEVLAIFDKEIIMQLEEEAKAAKALLNNSTKINSELYDLINQKNTLTRNITLYEGLLLEKKRKGENTIFIQDMLEKLLAQKIVIDHKILTMQTKENAISKKKNDLLTQPLSSRRNMSLKQNNSQLETNANAITNIYTKKERREMVLKDIFSFYSKQHNLIGVTPLFESIENKKSILDMAEFSKFCSDFNIALTKEKLVELFKKNTSNTRSMTYNEFVFILGKIAVSLNDSRKKYLNKKIEKTKEAIVLMEQNQLDKEEKENDKSYLDNNKSKSKPKKKEIINKELFDYNKAHKKHLEELSSLKYEHDRYMKKTYEEITNDFYVYLSLDNEREYSKKLKGYLLLPFHCQDKTYKTPNKILNQKGGNDSSNLIIALAQKKSEMEKITKAHELLKKDQLFRMKKEQMMIKNKILEKNIEMKMKENYIDLIKGKEKKGEIEENIIKKKKREIEKKNNVSWNRLGEMDSEYLELAEIEKNKEIFLETDNSDEMDLLNNLNIDHKSEDKQLVLAQKRIKLQQEKEMEKKKKEELLLKEEEERKRKEEEGNSVLDQGFIKDDSKQITKKGEKGMSKNENNQKNAHGQNANFKNKKNGKELKKGKSAVSIPAMPTIPQINTLVKSINTNNAILSDDEKKHKSNQQSRKSNDIDKLGQKEGLVLPPIKPNKLNKSKSDYIINSKSINTNSIAGGNNKTTDSNNNNNENQNAKKKSKMINLVTNGAKKSSNQKTNNSKK